MYILNAWPLGGQSGGGPPHLRGGEHKHTHTHTHTHTYIYIYIYIHLLNAWPLGRWSGRGAPHLRGGVQEPAVHHCSHRSHHLHLLLTASLAPQLMRRQGALRAQKGRVRNLSLSFFLSPSLALSLSLYVCMYVYIYKYVRVCVRVCVCAYMKRALRAPRGSVLGISLILSTSPPLPSFSLSLSLYMGIYMNQPRPTACATARGAAHREGPCKESLSGKPDVCMYVCMCIYTYIYTHIYTCVCVHIYI